MLQLFFSIPPALPHRTHLPGSQRPSITVLVMTALRLPVPGRLRGVRVFYGAGWMVSSTAPVASRPPATSFGGSEMAAVVLSVGHCSGCGLPMWQRYEYGGEAPERATGHRSSRSPPLQDRLRTATGWLGVAEPEMPCPEWGTNWSTKPRRRRGSASRSITKSGRAHAVTAGEPNFERAPGSELLPGSRN
jgi:hypothetical protein